MHHKLAPTTVAQRATLLSPALVVDEVGRLTWVNENSQPIHLPLKTRTFELMGTGASSRYILSDGWVIT